MIPSANLVLNWLNKNILSEWFSHKSNNLITLLSKIVSPFSFSGYWLLTWICDDFWRKCLWHKIQISSWVRGFNSLDILGNLYEQNNIISEKLMWASKKISRTPSRFVLSDVWQEKMSGLSTLQFVSQLSLRFCFSDFRNRRILYSFYCVQMQ